METSSEFEKLVSFIETTIKGDNNIGVLHNVSLVDNDGNNCQIDVLLENDLGERLGKVYIPIECKNWNKKKVERKDIGAFINLLDSLNISKGIYVSKKGFQRGARIKAEKSKRILLYTLDKNEKQEVLNWINVGPITRYNLIPRFETISITVEIVESEHSKLEQDDISFTNTFFRQNEMKLSFLDFFVKIHESISNKEFMQILKSGKERFGRELNGQVLNLTRKIKITESFSIIVDELEYEIVKLEFKYKAEMSLKKSHQHLVREYKESFNDGVDAQIFTARFEDSKVDFIKGKESEVIGYVTIDGSDIITTVHDLGRIEEEEEKSI